MTHLPASNLGLHDRGRLAEGMAADIVVFDPATITDRSTWEDPHRFSEGVEHVSSRAQRRAAGCAASDASVAGYGVSRSSAMTRIAEASPSVQRREETPASFHAWTRSAILSFGPQSATSSTRAFGTAAIASFFLSSR